MKARQRSWRLASDRVAALARTDGVAAARFVGHAVAHTRHMREACGFPSVGSRAVLVGIPEGCLGRREHSFGGRVSRPKAQNALLSVGQPL